MSAYIVRRLIQTIFVIFILSFFSFMIMHLIPGDPIIVILGTDATQQQIDALRAELWLDQPLMVQYGHWMGNALKGDFGRSLVFHWPVFGLIAKRLPVTIYLSMYALSISAILGIAVGIISATRRASILDQVTTVLSTLGLATPQFWIAILCVYGVGLKLGWLPIQGFVSPFDDLWLSLRQTIMPVFCLSVGAVANLARQTRSSMLEVIQQDYIRTAWAKGLRERRVVFGHALKNALIPVITMIGINVSLLFGGAVIVESVFNIPGIGRLLVSSVFNRDYVVVQGVVLVIALVVCFVNLAVDISYAYLDPRIRYE